MTRNAQLVVEIDRFVECERRFGYVFFLIYAVRILVIEFAFVSVGNGRFCDFDVLAVWIEPVFALAEYEFSRALIRFEIETERKVESEEGIFENFGEIVALTIVFKQIVGRFIVQACGQSVEGQIEIDAVAQGHKHAELKFGQIESVVEREADSAVEFCACKFDRDLV